MGKYKRGKDIEDAILDMDPLDQDDLGEDHPGVRDWIDAGKEGYDVEEMLEDFGTDYDEVEDDLDYYD